MTNTKVLLKALLGATALTVFTAGTAQAQNNFTQAGTSVSNTFTLDYKVGGVDQPQIDSTATPTLFTVDRLVDLTVTSNGDNTVAPGATDEELVFSVTNEGNDTQAYSLAIVEETATPDTIDTDAPTGAVPELVYYIDDGNGTFEPGAADGAPVTYNPASPPELGPDDVLWVVVTQDIPTSGTDGDQADVSLVADTLEPASSPNAGTPVTADGDGTNNLTGAAENVLADGSGTGNEVANAGDHSATGSYILVSADIDGEKVVSVYSEDGMGCATIPGAAPVGGYGIPGACVEYVISVENTGSAPATDVIVEDILPDELIFAAADFGGDFTGGSFTTLPGPNTDCISGACIVDFTGVSLPAPSAGATSTTGTVTIRAFVK